MPDRIEYNGIEYDWDELYSKMDVDLVNYIVNQYSGRLSKRKIITEYIAIEGWWHILRKSKKYEVKENDVTR